MRLVLISSPSCRIRALHPVSLRATTSTSTIQTLWETCHIPVADLKSIVIAGRPPLEPLLLPLPLPLPIPLPRSLPAPLPVTQTSISHYQNPDPQLPLHLHLRPYPALQLHSAFERSAAKFAAHPAALTFGLKEDLVSASQFVGHEISSLTGRAGGKGKRGGNVNGKADGMVVDGGDTGLEGETGSVVGGEAIVTGAGA
jgi:hypothetical protein